MWYTGGTTNINNLRIGYATSPDGANWTKHSGNPVFLPDNTGFDANAVGTASVMRDGSIYKMWYAASMNNPPTQLRIGYAESTDGINWTRRDDPVLDLGSPGEWDDYWVTLPTVVKDSSSYKMWYSGSRFSVGNERIGYATSADGINWTKYNDPSTTNAPYAESDPVLPVTPGSWDAFYVYQSCVILNNSNLEMWYAGNTNSGIQRIGYATSTVGIIWDKHPDPVLTESSHLLAPSVVYNSQDYTYRMWYTGNDRRIYFAYHIIPVELESFSAITNGSNINLTWVTATELNNHGFELFRNGYKIAFVQGSGTTTEKQEYFYEDKNLKDGIYNYRLEQIDFDGTRSISSEATVYLTIPKSFSLEQNYPNPFNPITKIKYSIPTVTLRQAPSDTRAILKVYDMLGRDVETLVNEFKAAGSYVVEFFASQLSSGTWFYRLQAGE
jgi:hypothetical protein